MSSRSEPSSRNDSLRDINGIVLLVGAGKMGSALLEGWLGLGMAPRNVAIIEPEPTSGIEALTARGLALNPSEPGDREIAAVVTAVKPQVAPEALPPLRPFIGPHTVAVSIMAGIPAHSPGKPRSPPRWPPKPMAGVPLPIGRFMLEEPEFRRVGSKPR